MPLFGKRRQSEAAPAQSGDHHSGAAVPDTDWADPEAVRAEWRNDTEAPNWGRAMEMFDEGPPPTQWLNIAEYFTRRLKLVLFDESALPDGLTAEVCRRILVLLGELPVGIEPEWIAQDHARFAPRLIRLPLAVMRDRGWQPQEYGGDGTVRANLNTRHIVAAVATTRAPDGDYLRYFFQGQSDGTNVDDMAAASSAGGTMIDPWSDPDLAEISVVENGQPQLRLGELKEFDPDDFELVHRFIEFDKQAQPGAAPEVYLRACSAAVTAFEGLSVFARVGWKKFLVFYAGMDAGLHWHDHRDPNAGIFAEWAATVIEAQGWGSAAPGSPLAALQSKLRDTIKEASLQHEATDNERNALVLRRARDAAAEIMPPIETSPTYAYLDQSRERIGKLSELLSALDLEWRPLDVGEFGAALVVPSDELSYTVVSTTANGAKPVGMELRSGVLRNVQTDLGYLVRECNQINVGAPGSAVVVDTSDGATVMCRVSLPLAVFEEAPGFLRQVVWDLAGRARAAQDRLRSVGVIGTQFGTEEPQLLALAISACR